VTFSELGLGFGRKKKTIVAITIRRMKIAVPILIKRLNEE